MKNNKLIYYFTQEVIQQRITGLVIDGNQPRNKELGQRTINYGSEHILCLPQP